MSTHRTSLQEHQSTRGIPQPFLCHLCARDLAQSTKWQRRSFRRNGYAYCKDCGPIAKKSKSQFSPEARAIAKQRMLTNNPMKTATIRQKVSQTLRRIGHRPPKQGGNGRGLTIPQRVLLQHLSEAWKGEHLVTTSMPRGGKSRSHIWYLLDLAHIDRKIAIEIDGPSHFSLKVRARDARKDAQLTALGWTVLRFSNADVLANTQQCLSIISKLLTITTTSPKTS